MHTNVHIYFRDRYGQPLAPHYEDRGPPPHPPQSYYGSGSGGGAPNARYRDEADYDDYETPDAAAQQPQPPTGPPSRSAAYGNSGGGSSAPTSRSQQQMLPSHYHSDPPYNESEWSRDSYGGRDSGATAAPPREHRHKNYE